MDIITHSLIGLVAAAPFLDEPMVVFGMVAGSVAPDLDVLGRLFGKRAMIRCHQTWSHALPLLLLLAGGVALIPGVGWPGGVGFIAGATIHVLLDWTNTLGVKLLWPLDKRRHQLSLIFFLDAFVTTASLLALTFTVAQVFGENRITLVPSIGLGVSLAGYALWKKLLLNRAKEIVGDRLVTITPSALWPWRFLVCVQSDFTATVGRVDVLRASFVPIEVYTLYDAEMEPTLSEIPEWHLMRELSPAYHAVRRSINHDSIEIFCRDLRIRQFNTTYGDLDLIFDLGWKLMHKKFHV